MTPRAIILGVVLLISLLTLLYPARDLVSANGDVHAMRAENERLAANLERLRERKDELSDPVVLEREARKRLLHVPVGAKLYVALRADDGERERVAKERRAQRTGDGPWYEQLGESLRLADQGR